MIGSRPRTLAWSEELPLGWMPGSDRGLLWSREPEYVFSKAERHVGILSAPTQTGKSTGIFMPALLSWPGAAIVASTKVDLRQQTGRRRRELAERYGGQVLAYDPLAEGSGGLPRVGFNLIEESRSASQAILVAQGLIFASGAGKGVSDASHWQERAQTWLQCCLHTAAWAERDIRAVKRWVNSGSLEEPRRLLEGSSSPRAADWGDDLRGLESTPERERGSIFSAVRTALGCLSLGEILDSVSLPSVNWEDFIQTRSTLFITGSSEFQKLIAPLTAGLVEAACRVQFRNYERGGVRLLLALDELANTAPIRNLESTASEGLSQGVTMLWSVQGHAQLTKRYSEAEARIVEQNTWAKIITGGGFDRHHLEDLSAWIGDEEVERRSTSRSQGAHGSRSESLSYEWRRRWPVERMASIPEGQALDLLGSYAPVAVNLPVAPRDAPWSAYCGPAA